MPRAYHDLAVGDPAKGAAARPARDGEALRRYVTWFREEALPAWAAVGFDEANGLFYERLMLDGTPDRTCDIRLRTHMRQVYVFAHAGLLGLAPREASLARAVKGMERARDVAFQPDGRPGWVHSVSQEGKVVDDRRDLYDHAFILHALAWIHEATGEARWLELITATLAAVDEVLAAPNGGWAESDRHELPRRQNPHMHLFEACLALYETTGAVRYLARARRILDLFRHHFFDGERKVLREFFGEDWRLSAQYGSDRLDPGHHMEWVWLLRRYTRSAPADVDGYCRDLLASGERLGLHGGFLVDEVDLAGTPMIDGRRLWLQTEHVKAHLVQFAATRDPRHRERAEAIVSRLFATYLAGPEPGLWYDRFTLDGHIAVDHVPASILYHLMLPVVEILRLEPGFNVPVEPPAQSAAPVSARGRR